MAPKMTKKAAYERGKAAGPARRTLCWILEGDRPIYESKPYLVLGKGVRMRPEWKKGTRSE